MIITITIATPLYSAKTAPVTKTLAAKTQFFCGYCLVLTYPKII